MDEQYINQQTAPKLYDKLASLNNDDAEITHAQIADDIVANIEAFFRLSSSREDVFADSMGPDKFFNKSIVQELAGIAYEKHIRSRNEADGRDIPPEEERPFGTMAGINKKKRSSKKRKSKKRPRRRKSKKSRKNHTRYNSNNI